ncbi:MAG: DUF2442 domain-containing protein [Ignavibacteriae bacterium]|nr:DUF2442 domain-containing protein [Ignavibacteriota bacterium]
MTPKLNKAIPLKPLSIELHYHNGEIRVIDISKYCKSDYFNELRDWNYFSRLKIDNGTVTWPHEQDIAPETLYLESKKYSN